MEPGPEIVLDPMGPNSTASGLSSVNSRLFAYAAALQKRGHSVTIASPEDLQQVGNALPSILLPLALTNVAAFAHC